MLLTIMLQISIVPTGIVSSDLTTSITKKSLKEFFFSLTLILIRVNSEFVGFFKAIYLKVGLARNSLFLRFLIFEVKLIKIVLI